MNQNSLFKLIFLLGLYTVLGNVSIDSKVLVINKNVTAQNKSSPTQALELQPETLKNGLSEDWPLLVAHNISLRAHATKQKRHPKLTLTYYARDNNESKRVYGISAAESFQRMFMFFLMSLINENTVVQEVEQPKKLEPHLMKHRSIVEFFANIGKKIKDTAVSGYNSTKEFARNITSREAPLDEDIKSLDKQDTCAMCSKKCNKNGKHTSNSELFDDLDDHDLAKPEFEDNSESLLKEVHTSKSQVNNLNQDNSINWNLSDVVSSGSTSAKHLTEDIEFINSNETNSVVNNNQTHLNHSVEEQPKTNEIYFISNGSETTRDKTLHGVEFMSYTYPESVDPIEMKHPSVLLHSKREIKDGIHENTSIKTNEDEKWEITSTLNDSEVKKEHLEQYSAHNINTTQLKREINDSQNTFSDRSETLTTSSSKVNTINRRGALKYSNPNASRNSLAKREVISGKTTAKTQIENKIKNMTSDENLTVVDYTSKQKDFIDIENSNNIKLVSKRSQIEQADSNDEYSLESKVLDKSTTTIIDEKAKHLQRRNFEYLISPFKDFKPISHIKRNRRNQEKLDVPRLYPKYFDDFESERNNEHSPDTGDGMVESPHKHEVHEESLHKDIKYENSNKTEVKKMEQLVIPIIFDYKKEVVTNEVDMGSKSELETDMQQPRKTPSMIITLPTVICIGATIFILYFVARGCTGVFRRRTAEMSIENGHLPPHFTQNK